MASPIDVRSPNTAPPCPVEVDEIFKAIDDLSTTYDVPRLPGSPTIFECRKHIFDTATANGHRGKENFEIRLAVLDDMIEAFRDYQHKYFHLLRRKLFFF